MFYRITIDLAYLHDANPKAILAHAKTLLHGATSINSNQAIEEPAFILLQRCYHDEPNPRPCETIELITV